jgi:hypothetical protein
VRKVWKNFGLWIRVPPLFSLGHVGPVDPRGSAESKDSDDRMEETLKRIEKGLEEMKG